MRNPNDTAKPLWATPTVNEFDIEEMTHGKIGTSPTELTTFQGPS